MLIIKSSQSAYLLSLLVLQLAVFHSTNALPASHLGTSSHASRHVRSARPAPSQPPIQRVSTQQALHQRRKRAPLVSSTPRGDAPMNKQIHLLSRDILPKEITPVRHISLDKRHRSHDEDQYDAEDDSSGDEEAGHDANGYDDGSWRGSNGNYGSEASSGNDSAGYGTSGDDSTSTKAGNARIKTAISPSGDSGDSSTDDGSTGGDADDSGSTADASDDSADTGHADGQDLKPASKIKTKASSGDDTADGDSATEEDDANTADDGSEADSDSASPKAKVKTVKNAKAADSEDDTGSTNNTKATRSPNSAKTGTGDCAALSKVYDEMGGGNWTVQDGWSDVSEKCCQAYGVSCNADSKVTALDLADNGLTGSLSASIFDLTALTRLNLTSNSISGSMPDKFDLLPHLSTVYLDQNSLSGTVPATLQNSSSIYSVHLSNNTLDGMLYFPNAYNLTQLYASKNQFTYLNIDANTALSKVVLDDNQFNCTLPDMKTFTSLSTFSAARNSFSGSPFDVTDLTNLTKLDLQHNLLTGAFPDVTKLPSLAYLALNGNDISGHFPSGPAPTDMTLCHIDPILTSSCPSSSVLSDPNSLAAKCQLKCRGGGKPVNATKEDDSDAAAEDGDEAPPKTKARIKTKSAAGQEGSTVDGDDSGQTPASLAAAYASGASKVSQGQLLGFAIPTVLFYLLLS